MLDGHRSALEAIAYGDDERIAPGDRLRALDHLRLLAPADTTPRLDAEVRALEPEQLDVMFDEYLAASVSELLDGEGHDAERMPLTCVALELAVAVRAEERARALTSEREAEVERRAEVLAAELVQRHPAGPTCARTPRVRHRHHPAARSPAGASTAPRAAPAAARPHARGLTAAVVGDDGIRDDGIRYERFTSECPLIPAGTPLVPRIANDLLELLGVEDSPKAEQRAAEPSGWPSTRPTTWSCLTCATLGYCNHAQKARRTLQAHLRAPCYCRNALATSGTELQAVHACGDAI